MKASKYAEFYADSHGHNEKVTAPKKRGVMTEKLNFKIFQEIDFSKKSKKSKKSIFFGMVRDALGSVGGSSLSIFTGFSKNFEKLKIRKLKIGRNPSEMRSKHV